MIWTSVTGFPKRSWIRSDGLSSSGKSNVFVGSTACRKPEVASPPAPSVVGACPRLSGTSTLLRSGWSERLPADEWTFSGES